MFAAISMMYTTCHADTEAIPQNLVTTELLIVAPADGAVVDFESPLPVSVKVTGNYKSVVVAGDGLGLTDEKTTAPYDYILQMPNLIAGKRSLTAVGLKANGETLFSTPISVYFEPQGSLSSLTVEPSQLFFVYAGQKAPLSITGILQDGKSADLTQSSIVVVTSQNPNILQIGVDKSIIAVAPGTTKVVVQAQNLVTEIPVTVQEAIPGDLNGDGLVDQHDINIVMSSYGQASGTMDARDANHDDVIDIRDVKQMVSTCENTVCTIPNENTLVPNVISAPRTDAEQKIIESSLLVGQVTESTSKDIPTKYVISQQPLPNTSVEVGKEVNLVISSGPPAGVPGDVNNDGVVNCTDLSIVKASFGKRTGQVGFDPRADVNKDGIVDIRDLSFVSRLLPAGTKCS